MTGRRTALLRLLLVCACAAVIVGAVLTQRFGVALTAGVAVGGLLFLAGMARGGGLGNARKFEKKPADMSARIGTCLAAAGIASAAMGYDPPFPPPFRASYGVCLAIACLGALALSVKGLKDTPPG